MNKGVNFHPVTIDTAKNVSPAIEYILTLNISPEDKIRRIIAVLNLIGADFYMQMFDANSEVFGSAAIQSVGYGEMADQVGRAARKIVRNDSLGREVTPLIKGFYDSALGRAQSEAFRNAVSLDKHPTITRTIVGETCSWCQDLAGTWTYEPNSELFRRHANCDCLIVVNGLGKRGGVVNNYVKNKGKE